jgi:outer membrane receptor protein involved in Fe transport
MQQSPSSPSAHPHRAGTFPRLAGIFLSAALALRPGYADTSSAEPGQDLAFVQLDRLVVMADRTPAADNSEIEARRLVSSEPFAGVTREEFGRRANRRAGDIVARLPGVFMGGPPGENKDARLRGLDKEFTRTQVDGLQLPDGGEKRELQLNRVPSDLVQEVRVLRNPSPEYESDGLAGRLDFRFRPLPREGSVGEARAALGRRNRADGTRSTVGLLYGTRLTPDFGSLISYTQLQDPTYKLKDETDRLSSGAPSKTASENELVRNRNRDLFADFAWYYPQGEIHLKPLRLDTREDKTKTRTSRDFAKTTATDETRETEHERKTKLGEGASLLHVHHWGESGTAPALDTRLSWQRVTETKPGKFTEAFKETAAGFVLDKRTVENEDKADRTVAADTKLTLPLGAQHSHLAKTGLAFRHRDRFRDKTKTEAKTPALLPLDVTSPKDTYFIDETYYAVFAQDAWTLHPDVTALIGARFEHVAFTSRTRTQAEVEAGFDDLNPNAQLSWRLRPDTNLKFAVSRALNRPKFDELSPYEQDDGKKITLGNPRLQPARAWKFDLGVDHARRDVFLGANLFYNQIDGLIESLETGELRGAKPVVQIQNVGDGWVYGAELEQRLGFRWTRLKPLAGLTLWANQTWLRSEVTAAATGLKKPFNGQPRFLANLGFDYELGRVYLTASARYAGPRPPDETSADLKEQKAEYPVDAALHLRLVAGLSLFIEANNLTDEDRVETTRRANGTTFVKTERTGRAWFAGARCQF